MGAGNGLDGAGWRLGKISGARSFGDWADFGLVVVGREGKSEGESAGDNIGDRTTSGSSGSSSG